MLYVEHYGSKGSLCHTQCTINYTPKNLEQTLDVTSLRVQVDVVETGTRRQTGHSRHGTDQGVDKASSCRKPDVSDRQSKASGDTLFAWVVRERECGLGHTDGQTTVALRLVSLDFGLGL